MLHEVLRFGNIFPLSVTHRATADGFLGGGRYFIPGGTDIHCNLGAVLRDPKHFPRPEVFDPTRWGKQSVHSNAKTAATATMVGRFLRGRHLSADGGTFAPHPKVVAFGMGKRRCLGEALAKVEMYVFFAAIVSRFEIRCVLIP